jgi:hypothetical protein
MRKECREKNGRSMNAAAADCDSIQGEIHEGYGIRKGF